MCPKKLNSVKNIAAEPVLSDPIAEIRSYTPPVYRTNKSGRYIEFYAFDPVKGRLRRKTIKLNRISGAGAARTVASGIIRRLNTQLANGWSPWISNDTGNLTLLSEALERYEAYVDKMYSDGLYRKETYVGYKSYTKILRQYITENPISYVYQFDRKYCGSFLDWVFIDRNCCAQTRNNYLNYLRVLSGYMLEKGYVTVRPSDGLQPINKRLIEKTREVIPGSVVGQISRWLEIHDKPFLLACYLLYYCFIRPVEMTRLRISDIHLHDCTILMRSDQTKNKREQSVTVPKKVLLYALSLGIFDRPGTDFLFSSDNLRPGPHQIDPKIFRDHWAKVHKALRLKTEWKFYSLKDTGISEMLENNMVPVEVRDQARHSSLATTEIYLRHAKTTSNKDIIDIDGSL